MSLTIVKQDLFTFEADAYGHGVNAVGVMGSGIAPEFKKRWPDMYEEYRKLCQTDQLGGGEVFPWYHTGTSAPNCIFNMCTQIEPGANAKYPLIRKAFETLVSDITEFSLSVETLAIPMIGCGIGGLDSAAVLEIIDLVVGDKLEVTVCVL